MSRFAVSLIVAWASRRRVAVLVGVMCAVLVSVEGIRRLSFDADILALLPQNGRVTPAFREFLDIRSDLYSLGATFYHMLCGQVPFTGASPASIMARHLHERPRSPRDVPRRLRHCRLRRGH